MDTECFAFREGFGTDAERFAFLSGRKGRYPHSVLPGSVRPLLAGAEWVPLLTPRPSIGSRR